MLVLQKVTKWYNDIPALRQCSFKVNPGRIVGFLGPNGAGKTTAMRSVVGLVRPDTGELVWNDHHISHRDRLAFGYMPEERGLYLKMRVRQHLVYLARLRGLPRHEAYREVNEWIERLGLTRRAEARIKDLSKGNQQRVQLIAALLNNPKLLVLDEPFSGLDPPSREEVVAILQSQACEGTAILFSSHELDFADSICDDVVVINQGSIVMNGDLAELKESFPYRCLEISCGDDRGHLDLISKINGVSVLNGRNQSHVFLIPAEVDLRLLLSTVPSEAPIRSCKYSTLSLPNLFGQVIRCEPEEM